MKVVILAGGLGTRLAEYTDRIPKPMVPIGGKPILWHIMNIYASQGLNEFVLALGYKADVVKNYFNNFYTLNSDFTVDLSTNEHVIHQHKEIDWKITLVDTGLHTMTGGRIKRLAPYLEDEPFCVTYGDGVANVDVRKSIEFHKSHGKLATMTVVHPPARFGTLHVNEKENTVAFREKSRIDAGWINGGFFVLQPETITYLGDDTTMLEQSPLITLAEHGQLVPFEHEGFWQCMDTKRDNDYLNDLWDSGKAPWKTW